MPNTAIVKSPTKPRKVITSPNRQKIDVSKALRLRLQGNTFQEIANIFGVTDSAVCQALDKFKQFTSLAEPGALTAYSENRADLFNAVEARLTASLLDEDTLAKASLNNRAYAFKQIHEARRLESGQSTSNLSVLAKVIQQAESKLGATPQHIDKQKIMETDNADSTSQAVDSTNIAR